MNKQALALYSLLLLSFNALAQPWTGKNAPDVMYKKRIQRVVSVTDPKNETLLTIYDSAGRTHTITDIANDAIINQKIAIYDTNDDTLTLMDSLQLVKLISYTYDSTKTTQTLLIDNIIIAEDWQIDENTGKMTRDYQWFLLCSNKKNTSGKTIPIYKLRTDGFMDMCRPYYILSGSNKTQLTAYFENRMFNSNIINVKTVETKFNKNFKRPKEFSEVILTH